MMRSQLGFRCSFSRRTFLHDRQIGSDGARGLLPRHLQTDSHKLPERIVHVLDHLGRLVNYLHFPAN
jgi:hypothetical protein